jgi:UDP-glucose 4-epimerase
MKAVLLGGNGFIGTHLTVSLIAAGFDCISCDERPPQRALGGVRWADMDVFQASDDILREVLAGADVVYHLAWRYLPATSNRHMEAEAAENVPGTLHLLRLCVASDVRRVVFFSSGGSVYGPAQHLPIAETHPTEPLTAHAVSKLAVEKYLDIFALNDGLDYVILRPGNPFGPYQDPNGGQGAIAAFMARAAAGRPLEVWGDGSVMRDYFYVGDLARAARLAATTAQSRAVYNIAAGVGRSLNDVIAAIETVVGHALIVHRLPARSSDASVNILDITRARQMLGWTPQTSFEDGLRRTWTYYLQTDGS